MIREELSGAAGIAVELVEWSSLEELAGDRLFEDSRATEYAAEHGFLTRRSEIVLDKPGGCRVQSG